MTLAVVLAWLGAVIAGMALLDAHANSPGESAVPPASWPEASHLSHHAGQPTLVMFIHPQCPCSSASIGELALLMAHCQGKAVAQVLFLRPKSMPLDWAQTQNWHDAQLIPGVTVLRDDDGQEAQLFNAKTSGETALYDAQGRLAFHGGITGARGHSGDNAGRDALTALLNDQPPEQTTTPTFGCSLFACPRKDPP